MQYHIYGTTIELHTPVFPLPVSAALEESKPTKKLEQQLQIFLYNYLN